MTVAWCWSLLMVHALFWRFSQHVIQGFPVSQGSRTVEMEAAAANVDRSNNSSSSILALIGISVASVASLVVVVGVCLCCYPRPSGDDSDSEDQNKFSDDQGDAGETSHDERKQLTNQTSQQSRKTINFPWPMSELSSISIKSIQPDQFGQSSLNKSLGVTSSQQQQLHSSLQWPQQSASQAEHRMPGAGEDSASAQSRDLEGYSDSYAEHLANYPESPNIAPRLGRIQFRISYDFHQYVLTLKLMNAVELPAKDFSGTSDPYVKIYLLPDRKHKLLSNIKRKCLNPFWNETFTFEGFPYEKLMSKSLYLQVLDYDRFSRDDPIGEVIIPLCDLDLQNPVALWRDLQPCQGHVGQLGELLISLCYNPKLSTINVGILRARLLKAKDITGLSDPYVKIWLLRDGKRVEKKKTVVHQKTLSPVFNSNFTFNVPYEHIRRTSLLISVMDHDFIGINELMGQLLLSCKSSPVEAKHWNEMLTKPRQTLEKWHLLKDLG